MARLDIETVTIANGASLSGAIGVDGEVIGVIIPAAWTDAAVSFKHSPTSVTANDFKDVYKQDGTTAVSAGGGVGVNQRVCLLDNPIPGGYIKCLSGTPASAVAQGGVRTLILLIRPYNV